jgi:hypothetical protein
MRKYVPIKWLRERDSVRLINNFYKPLDFIVPIAIALTSEIALDLVKRYFQFV